MGHILFDNQVGRGAATVSASLAVCLGVAWVTQYSCVAAAVLGSFSTFVLVLLGLNRGGRLSVVSVAALIIVVADFVMRLLAWPVAMDAHSLLVPVCILLAVGLAVVSHRQRDVIVTILSLLVLLILSVSGSVCWLMSIAPYSIDYPSCVLK